MRPVSIANNHSGNGTGTTGAAGATGTTTTGSDAGLSPWLLRAFKVMLTPSPLVKLVMVIGLVVSAGSSAT
jgi:hypothetical protein